MSPAHSSRVISILFLGGAKRVSLAKRFISAAQTLGVEVKFFSYELSKEVPISLVAEVIVGLRWSDKEILAHLTEVVKRNHIDIILPSVDPAITLAASLARSSDVFSPVSDPAICDLFYDKMQAQRWLGDHDFPVPLLAASAPLIAKPRFGSASKGIIIIKDNQEIKHYQDIFNNDQYVVQEFIDGEEYTIDSYVALSGKILAVVPRKRIEVTAGEVTKALTIRDPAIIALATSIIVAARLKGPLNLQMIKTLSGALYIIEVNPRFGGGVITSIEAGADMPAMVLRDFLGLSNPPVDNWKDHLFMMRMYQELFIHSYANNH